ncbi:MAG: hypothetical protein K8R38_04230 [Verrucomicrobia bacterium]|nr:hypothetical protein [Verrucomicrobiota bacterium]
MNTPILDISLRPYLGSFLVAMLVLGSQLKAQTQSPEQTLAAMDQCREQVISQLSFGDKMKMKAAMGVIQSNPQFIAANAAVTNAPTLEDKIAARKTLAKVKLDLIAQQDPSLKPVVDKIRTAQAAVLK